MILSNLTSIAANSWSFAVQGELFRVNSPNGKVTITFRLASKPHPYLPGGRAYYRILYLGETIIAGSPLGPDFKGATPLDRPFEGVGSDRMVHNLTWENHFGPRRRLRDHYQQLTVTDERVNQERELILILASRGGAAVIFAPAAPSPAPR